MVADLLNRVLDALLRKTSTASSERTMEDELADFMLKRKWEQLNCSPIREPKLQRPDSQLISKTGRLTEAVNELQLSQVKPNEF